MTWIIVEEVGRLFTKTGKNGKNQSRILRGGEWEEKEKNNVRKGLHNRGCDI